MARLPFVTILAALASASSAFAQTDINEQVVLQTLDLSTNRYGGYVGVSAAPCPNVNYSIILPVTNVKNFNDALNQVRGEFEKISADINRDKKTCGSHQ